MEEVDAMINQDHHHANTLHQPSKTDDRPPADAEAAAFPGVPGFTPINGRVSFDAPEAIKPKPVSSSTAKKGKKRPAAATLKTTVPRQPKKAKQAAVSTKDNLAPTSTVSKSLLDNGPFQDQKANHADILELSVHASPSKAIAFPTHSTSPSMGGLNSTYQAAFQQEVLPTVPEEDTTHTPKSFSADEKAGQAPPLLGLQPARTPTSLWPEQHHLSNDAISADSGGSGIPNDAVASPKGLMPSYSGAMVSGQQYLLEENPDSWDIITPAATDFPEAVRTEVQSTNTNAGYCDTFGSSQFDEFFTKVIEEDCSPMELSESEMKCPTERKIVPQELLEPELAMGSDTLSYLSDADLVQSSDDIQNVNISHSQPLLESSSPYRQSPSGHQLVSHQEASSRASTPDNPFSTEDMYDDKEIDMGFLDFQSPPSAQVPPPSPPESPDQKRVAQRQMMPPDLVTPVTSPVKPAVPLFSPKAASTPRLAKEAATLPESIPHKVSCDENGAPIPFMRPVFPQPIRDRSHVLGLSSRTVLRTCFRIGEALNAGSDAIRTRKDAVIELYARVSYSERPTGSVKQRFQFADIFSPDKPPFLKGTYGLWKGVSIWDQDSNVFLGEKGKGKMARVVGRIGREEKSRGLEMTVLSIWEVDWEDVGVCKGHYCG
ncbi:MAG: hypothetical protein Q9168_002692 [Polycauliona sp. 1 TL-2023]